MSIRPVCSNLYLLTPHPQPSLAPPPLSPSARLSSVSVNLLLTVPKGFLSYRDAGTVAYLLCIYLLM